MAQRIYAGRLIYGRRPGTIIPIWMVVTNLDLPEQEKKYIEVETGDYLQIFYGGTSFSTSEIIFDGTVADINMTACEAVPTDYKIPFLKLLVSRIIIFHAKLVKEPESWFANIFSQS